MVNNKLHSADALPSDVLPLFFHWLTNATDLASVALVSKTWKTFAVARLYSTILYTLELAKKHERVLSPFDVLVLRPEYMPYVKHLTIRGSPTLQGKVDIAFIGVVSKCVSGMANLSSLSCNVSELLPSVLGWLAGRKSDKLTSLKIEANLVRTDAVVLTKLKGLKQLSLDSPTRIALHFLPDIVSANSETLRSLAITNSYDLDREHLSRVLSRGSNITSLQIQSSVLITHGDVLAVIQKYEMPLVSLSITVLTAVVIANPLWVKFLTLKNLTIHFRQCPGEKFSDSLLRILETADQAPLESFTLLHVDRVDLPLTSLQSVARNHCDTLKRFNLIGVDLPAGQLSTLPKLLPELEQLGFGFRIKQHEVSKSIKKMPKIVHLIDTTTALGHALSKGAWTTKDVYEIFQNHQSQTLRTISLTGRTYTAVWSISCHHHAPPHVYLKRDHHPFIYQFSSKDGKLTEHATLNHRRGSICGNGC